jgi:tetratricopeptide (TPR) repeat protein/class 3 adenylate cyclase
MSRLWSELSRRKVTRVAVAYFIVGWAVIEIADTVFPYLNLPTSAVTLVIALVVLGFPVSMVVAWGYDMTPGGLRRTERMPADWPRVQEILGNAFELPAAERSAYIRHACGNDSALLREIESLIAAHDRPGVLDAPAPPLQRVAAHVADRAPALSRAAPHYEMLDRIGGGGMGVVYRARDRRLERIVALKFLPPHMTGDEQAKERFLVEAQAAAALDHPNICTIYEAGETDDGHLFLAMPFYDGETLKRRLERGPLPVAEALDIAHQVASGLARAHERGIVHRDIKPANLVIAPEGIIKILDFGVAKLASVAVTRPGMALGTLAYMSPEQAQGDDVDGRTDLWSLGVVLYEMLTGVRPFRGDHDRVVLNAITTAEPALLGALRADLPPGVEDVVLQALAKRRTDRYADARELLAALDAVRNAPQPTRATAGVGSGALPEGSRTTAGAATALTTLGDVTSGGLLAEGERRHATIVVSVLAEYQDLVEQLEPDRLNLMMDRLRDIAHSTARAHGGMLNQFDGEQLVLLFGIPVSQEDDAARATRAALELHAILARGDSNRGADMILLHTGVDTGTVVSQAVENGDRAFRVTGHAPQLAARLAEHAGPGEVWLSADCRNLVAPYFEMAECDALRLRGGRQVLVPWRVLGESGLHTRIEAAERIGLTAFTGRDLELTTLRACLANVLNGEGQIVTITGDAGLGKSRLLHEFRQHVSGSGAPILPGRCQSYGGGVAYLPFIDILRGALCLDVGEGVPDVEETVTRIRAISSTLEEFIPLYLHLLSIRSTAHPVPKHLQGDAFRLAMQEALAAPGHAERAAAAGRDRAGRLALGGRRVAGGAAADRRGAGRISAARAGHGASRLWRRSRNDRTVHAHCAEAAGRAGDAAMLGSVLNVEQPCGELVALVHERTGGNPFYIEEICQALLEQGSITIDAGAAQLARPHVLELPDSIQGVIRARLDRLERGVRDVLRVAAVIGREFTRTVLERALTDHAELAQSLDTLKASGLIQQTRVVPDPAYRFKHVLTHEVAYASLLEHQRRDLHGRVGAIIEELHGEHTDDQLDRLAHHFSRAEQWQKAVQYGLRSAERANRLAQYPEALQVLERTQRWVARLAAGPERDTALTDILLQQERLCETLGQRARQQQIIDQLITILSSSSDRSRLAEVYLRQGDLFTLLRRFGDAEHALQQSLALRRELGDRVGERNTLRSLGLLRWHEERNAEALEVAEETLRIDRERGDLAAIVGDLTNCGAILRALGEHDRARVILQEAIDIAEDVSPGGAAAVDSDELALKRVYALQHLANIHRERGDRAQALECLQRAGAIAEQKRLPIQIAYHYTSLAHVLLQEGRVDESLRYYGEAIDMSRRARHASGLANSLRIFGEVLIGLGRHEDALPHLTEAATIFAELRDVDGEARTWSAVATVEERLARPGLALAAWGRAVQLLAQVGDVAGELAAVEGLARTTREHVNEPSLVLSHYQRGVVLAAAAGDAAAEGRMRNVMGILEWSRGEYTYALMHYERAYALFTGLGDMAAAALMLNSMGATLKVLGRSDEAVARLESALELHRRTGEQRLEGHALALLADILVERDQTDGAAEYYARSLEIRRAVGDRRGEGWMLHGLARCELVRGVPFRVREHLTAAAQVARECDDPELATACEQLRRIAD